MRIHKTPIGRVVAGLGLVLTCVALGPELATVLNIASAPADVAADVDVAEFMSTVDKEVGLVHAPASMAPAFDVASTGCAASPCVSLDLGAVADAQRTYTNLASIGFAGQDTGPSSIAPTRGQGGTQGAAGSAGSAAGGITGSERLAPNGPVPGTRPGGRDEQALAPILLALTSPDSPLEAAEVGVAAWPVDPDSSGVPATAALADPPAVATIGPVAALLPAGPGSIDHGQAPSHRATDVFKLPSAVAVPPAKAGVEPVRAPAALAALPGHRPDAVRDGSLPTGVPNLAANHPILGPVDARGGTPESVDPVNAALTDLVDHLASGDRDDGIGRKDSNQVGDSAPVLGSGPADPTGNGPVDPTGSSPVNLVLNGPDQVADSVADDVQALAGETDDPLSIVPVRDATALAPAVLAAADVAEPSTLALIGLAALGLVFTRGRGRLRRRGQGDVAAT